MCIVYVVFRYTQFHAGLFNYFMISFRNQFYLFLSIIIIIIYWFSGTDRRLFIKHKIYNTSICVCVDHNVLRHRLTTLILINHIFADDKCV